MKQNIHIFSLFLCISSLIYLFLCILNKKYGHDPLNKLKFFRKLSMVFLSFGTLLMVAFSFFLLSMAPLYY